MQTKYEIFTNITGPKITNHIQLGNIKHGCQFTEP